MNSIFISICLMFSSLPFCDVESISNDEFAKSFDYVNFQNMLQTEEICISEALRTTSGLKCDVDKAENSSEELKKCEDSAKADINQIIKSVNSKEFERKGCSAWLIGWDDNYLSKEYKRRKELLK
mgnify:CR=1 FL=1